MAAADNSPLKTAAVQAHSAQLRKELGLFDLVLAQILIIIVADYMGTSMISKSQAETEVSERLEEKALEAEMRRLG